MFVSDSVAPLVHSFVQFKIKSKMSENKYVVSCKYRIVMRKRNCEVAQAAFCDPIEGKAQAFIAT